VRFPDPKPFDFMREAEFRRQRCEIIVGYARAKGIDATLPKVIRQFRIWNSWYEGRLATGYLMRQTGVKYISTGDRKA
jgi:hypothetical protein